MAGRLGRISQLASVSRKKCNWRKPNDDIAASDGPTAGPTSPSLLPGGPHPVRARTLTRAVFSGDRGAGAGRDRPADGDRNQTDIFQPCDVTSTLVMRIDFCGIAIASLRAMAAHRVSWLLYLVGSLLVFGSWVNIVPTGVGWIGWLMALVGWAIGHERAPDPHARTLPSIAEQLETLDSLRQRQVITEEEFDREKRRLLAHHDHPPSSVSPTPVMNHIGSHAHMLLGRAAIQQKTCIDDLHVLHVSPAESFQRGAHETRPPLLGKPPRTQFPTAPTRISSHRALHTKFRTLPIEAYDA